MKKHKAVKHETKNMKGELKGKLSEMRTKTSKEANVVQTNYKYSIQEWNLLSLLR